MPFFQGARDFDIHNGAFYDISGMQTNYRYDNSLRISGTNNTATLSPDLSRNDNRINRTVDQQEWQDFLAWRQQGSPTAPHRFQLQTTINGPHPHPQITGCPVHHREISANNPPQFHPNAHTVNSPSPPSDNHATSRPSFYDNSNNVQGSTSMPVCPGHCRASSHNQPNLSSAKILSQQSEILSDDSKERMFPGVGAVMDLEARFGQQATKLHPVDHAGSHAHFKSHPVPQLPAHVGTALQVQLGASQHGTFQHGTYLAPPPAGALPSSPPPLPPPADNVTVKFQQPRPSVPLTTVPPSEPHSQDLQTFTVQSLPPYGRPSSASSFDSHSSDSTGSDEKQKISLQPGPNAACHADVLSTSSRAPLGSALNNTDTPMCSVGRPGSLSLQANNLAGGPGPNPSAVLSQQLTQAFSNSDEFADLIPLYHQANTTLPPKKKKRAFLSLFARKN